jgi:putative oxidoreductase
MPIADESAMPLIAHALQLGLGGVLLAAVVPKLRRPAGFARTVRGYGLLPPALAPAVAAVLIVVESFLALALLTGSFPAAAAPLAIATLLVFIAAVGINLQRGRRVPCGCFGETSEALSARSVARLSLLLAAAVLLALLGAAGAGPLTVDRLVAGGWAGLADGAQAAALAAFLLMLGVWALNLPELVALLSSPARAPGTAGRPEDRGSR